MALRPVRLRYQPKGFRVKMSSGWFVYDDVERTPVAGPFDHKGRARSECVRIKQERTAMGKPKDENEAGASKTGDAGTTSRDTDGTGEERTGDRSTGGQSTSGDGGDKAGDEAGKD